MSLISTWSTIANDNGTLGSTPFYWPEGQAPSTVNDCARLMMATIRSQWNDAQWFNWGYTVARASGSSFTVITASWNTVTVANVFETGGRLKFYDTSTLYGTITTVSVSAASVLVTFTPDTGSLTASFSSVYNSIITADQKSIPSAAVPADVVRQSGAQIYGTDGGATDAYAISMTPTLTSYVAGQAFNFFANSANTGAATLNIDGLGAKSITFPDGSALTDNYIAAGSIVRVVYDGTKFQISSPNSSGGGGASAATQADMEAGTSTTTYVSPGRAQFHPSASKFWARFNNGGSITASYNVTSVVDGGVGIATITITTSMSSANYAVFGCVQADSGFGRFMQLDNTSGPTATTFRMDTYSDASTFADGNAYMVCGFGDE